MKNITFIVMLLVLPTGVFSQLLNNACPETPVFMPTMPECDDANYEIIFEDNFDGNSLDLNKWDAKTGVTRNEAFDFTKVWYQPENLVVNNGTLKITAEKLQTPLVGTYYPNGVPQTSTFDYTSGELWTIQDFYYGKFEIRCKLPNGQGFFPAFWMFGGSGHSEIDVFDLKDANEKFYCSPGYDFDGDGNAEGCGYNTDDIPDFSEWHTFTLIFEWDKIIWQIDDITYHTHYRFKTFNGIPVTCGEVIDPGTYTMSEVFPLERMRVIMNLAIRSLDEAPNESTVFPNYYEVDYVRVSKKAECDGCLTNITYQNLNQLPTITRTQDYIQTQNDVLVQSGQNIQLKSKKIILKPGTKIEMGSTFNAKIEHCDILTYTEQSPDFIGSNAIDNYQIVKCIDPVYKISAIGVDDYSIEIRNLLGQLVHNAVGVPTSNEIPVWNTNSVATGWYNVHQVLNSCSSSDILDYDLLVVDCRSSTITDSLEISMYGTKNEATVSDGFYESIERIDFYIYPNPVADNLYIFYSISNETSINFSVIDISGREIINQNNNCKMGTNENRIDISNLSMGTYILVMKANNQLLRKTFIVSR